MGGGFSQYDPMAEYVVVNGRFAVKGPGNNRTYVAAEDVDENGRKPRFSLPYRTAAEIAFLVEAKKVLALASDDDGAQATETAVPLVIEIKPMEELSYGEDFGSD